MPSGVGGSVSGIRSPCGWDVTFRPGAGSEEGATQGLGKNILVRRTPEEEERSSSQNTAGQLEEKRGESWEEMWEKAGRRSRASHGKDVGSHFQ